MEVRKTTFKKAMAVLLTFILTCAIIPTFMPHAEAYATWNDCYLINGVGQSGNYTRNYWFDTSTLNSTWQTKVDDAMYAWCHTGSQGCGVYTSVWFYRTTTKSWSVIDFYGTDLGNGIYGRTHVYTGSGSSSVEIYPYNTAQNWVWAKVELNTTYSDAGSLTTTQKLVMVEHEIGHSFGLAHVYNTSVIMYPYADVCTATRPTVDDCNGVNYLYGGYNP